MAKFRLSFLFLVLVSMTAVAASAQTKVSPPSTGGPYDGRCTFNWIEHHAPSGWSMVDYFCNGTFIGGVEAELHVEYMPSWYAKYTLAPQGHVSASYQAPNVPSFDALYTVAPVFSGYSSRAVATLRWETDNFQCSGWGWRMTCGRVWESQTITTNWQSH